VALNVQGLTFFGREGQNKNGTQLRGRRSKISNISEENPN
jgi:hypothetical protein